ncbi:Het-C-domain-containing protein [Patellaria atrata CBS 101060]|uniref:Het-C-domain-containing protein n=1 Tax=Patellaria atrata CBS 101060 TaxID=1346257 RepID=A0A9P4VMZ8_9PEZI|nr:Het-C-domain-containing protein [Patellaria atrata CBS 101060]
MPDLRPSPSLLLPCLLLFILWAKPTHAFGAGNIASTAKIEGSNWRHGDIEDTLLTLLISRTTNKKFNKMDVKRVYFGNWLRDYSQAVDVGTLKMVSAEAIRILLWVLSFMSFGYGTGEFEVTHERLGCYRPEEHIDNPKDYADNIDARQYDRRLRGPIDEHRELSIDERTGLKTYIASEDYGITTSAGLVRNLFTRSIQLGRRYNRSKNKADLYEALRLLGTGCHCLEDYSAHSNYTELALIELGERDVFPHVGRRTQVEVRGARGPIWPLVTGTFGGVDFLHSVMGEISDKATQSEVQELEGTIAASENAPNNSALKDLLDKLPEGLFGGKDEAGKADELQQNAQAHQMQNMHITPREPEEFTRQMQEITKQIYPILEFHDEIMHSITEAIEQIPVLPELLEQLQEQVNIFVFSLLAPYVLPIIRQVKNELATGSSEIIQSSREKQHIVFHDDSCSDPTHSMLSKDHFSNVLNEPAGKIASQVLKWVVPQIVECWDNDRVDIDRTLSRIINGVFHHPALRNYGDDGASDGRQLMFRIVEDWWHDKSERAKDDLRDKLSRNGVEQGRNHKEGVHDKGHGCGKPLGMPNMNTALSSGAIGGNVLGNLGGSKAEKQAVHEVSKAASEAVGGGALGGLVGGLVGGVGASLLGGAFQDDKSEKKKSKKEGYNKDGSYSSSYQETGHRKASRERDDRYGQAEYKTTEYPGGARSEEYSRYEQDGRSSTTGYGYKTEVHESSYGGGYERREETRYERPGGQWQSEEKTEGFTRSGEYYSSESRHYGSKYGKEDDSDEDYEKKQRKKAEKERKKREKEQKKKYGRRDDDDDEDDDDDSDDDYEKKARKKAEKERKKREKYGGSLGEGERTGYGERPGYGGGEREYHSEQQEYGSGDGYTGRQEYSSGGGYGSHQQEYGSSGGYGSREEYGGLQEYGSSGYGRREEYGSGGGYGQHNEYGSGGSYGERREHGGRDEYGERREHGGRDEYGEWRGYGEPRGYGDDGYERRY